MLQLYKIKIVYFSILIMCLYTILCLIYNYVFLSETLFLQWFEGVMTQEQILSTISFFKKWEWGSILINILIIFIKITYVASCIFLGLFFYFEQHDAFKISFNIALKAEIVFVFYLIVRIIWFGVINIPESLEAIQVWPLSLMSFFDPNTTDQWLIYPLNTLNIFEVLYMLMLSALLATAIKIKFRKAFDLVFVSYSAGILLLIVAQMFFILNNS